MVDRLEKDDAFCAEVGYFGSITEDPKFLWSDPADPGSDDAAELVRLLQERRVTRPQCSYSIPGMPGVEPISE